MEKPEGASEEMKLSESVGCNQVSLSERMTAAVQGWIQEFILGGPNQGPQSKVKGESRIEGAKRPSIEGEARVEGAKRSRIEGEARTEGKAQEKAGEGSGEGAR